MAYGFFSNSFEFIMIETLKYLKEIFQGCSTNDTPTERSLVIEQILKRVDGIGISGESQKGDQVSRISR